MKNFLRQGILVIISSPSGAGKTTICKRLLKEDENLYLSVSVTTRKKRQNEVEGKDYFFYSKNDFKKIKSKDKFIETAIIFGNFYGTLKEEVITKLNKGIDVIIDIDWQGTRQINKYMKGNVIKIFLLPPSIEELLERLSSRGTESPEEIKLRMSKAIKEIKHFDEYDYVLVNENIDMTFKKIKTILESERMRLINQKSMIEFISRLSNN